MKMLGSDQVEQVAGGEVTSLDTVDIGPAAPYPYPYPAPSATGGSGLSVDELLLSQVV